MEFLTNNYLIIIVVGLFFVFALIGYLIDMFRNNKETEKEETSIIKPVEIQDLNTQKKVIVEENITTEEKNENDGDDLLKSYDQDISE